MEAKTQETYEVTVPGCREKFESWIKDRQGVEVWVNQDLSNMSRGNIYTPHLNAEGKTGIGKPHWAYMRQDLVTDIKRFKFVKEMKEVKRVKIALNPRLQGFMGTRIDLTAGSTRRVRKCAAQLKEKHGVEPCYHFEDLECVFEIPIWE